MSSPDVTLPISVIIPARNAASTIATCLSAAKASNPAEIIVIDGDSTDGTQEIASAYTDKVFSDEGKGLSYARQLGAQKATQEFVAYVDSDVALGSDALARMLESLLRSGCVWTNARLASDMKCSGYWEWARYQHDLLSQTRGTLKHSLSTVAGLTRRETVLAYGFNIAEARMDDADLDLRLQRDGHTCGGSPALFYKRYPADLESLVAQRYLYGLLAPRYLRKYGVWHTRFWVPFTDVYWLGFCVVRFKPKLIPYFAVDAIVQAAGALRGLSNPHLKPLTNGGS